MTDADSMLGGLGALVTAVVLAYRGKSLIVVALSSSAAVLVISWLAEHLG